MVENLTTEVLQNSELLFLGTNNFVKPLSNLSLVELPECWEKIYLLEIKMMLDNEGYNSDEFYLFDYPHSEAEEKESYFYFSNNKSSNAKDDFFGAACNPKGVSIIGDDDLTECKTIKAAIKMFERYYEGEGKEDDK